MKIVIPLAVAALAVVVYLLVTQAASADGPVYVTEKVRRGPLTIAVSQSGTVQNREQVTLKSEVPGSNMILYIIEEGVYVQPDELLVELDSSDLEDRKANQEITVTNAEASAIKAEQDLEVTKLAGAADIRQAELDLKFAQDDKRKYIEGEYPQELQSAKAEIQLATSSLEQAQNELNWSRKLSEKGYITANDLQADEADYERAVLNLKLAKGDLHVLEEYTNPRKLEELDSEIDQARKALERTRLNTSSDLIQAKAQAKAQRSAHEREVQQLQEIEDRIAKCTIKSPIAGQVVYATTGKASWRGNLDPLEKGIEVRERQELINLPTSSAMIAKIMVPDVALQKVRVGLPAQIKVDAVPDRVYYGTVADIGLYPDAHTLRRNEDLKLYETTVLIDKDTEGLRVGLSCNVDVLVQELSDALYVPVQCVVQNKGQSVVYMPDENGGEAKPVPVEVGLDNGKYIHIVSGVSEGQDVLLNPPLDKSGVEDRSQSVEIPDEIRKQAAELQNKAAAKTNGQNGAGNRPNGAPKKLSPEDFKKLPADVQEKIKAAQKNGTMPQAPNGARPTPRRTQNRPAQ